MDYNSIDKSNLTDLQRRNLAAWKLKQFEIKQQYGDKVQIVNTLDEILSMKHPLTVPVSAINTDKQLSIIMEELREDPDGTVSLVHERGDMPVANTVSDVTAALERQVELWEEIERARNVKKRKNDFVVPKGYKLVKIDEEEQVSESTKVAADILTGAAEVKNSIGVSIPKEQPAMSRDEAAKALLDMLM